MRENTNEVNMTPTTLEFTAEELMFHAGDFSRAEFKRAFGENELWFLARIASIANQALQDKLANAPIVFGHYNNTEWHIHDNETEEDDKRFYTSARLVCIQLTEKLEGK